MSACGSRQNVGRTAFFLVFLTGILLDSKHKMVNFLKKKKKICNVHLQHGFQLSNALKNALIQFEKFVSKTSRM